MCTSAIASLDTGENAILIAITGSASRLALWLYSDTCRRSYRTSIFRVALHAADSKPMHFEEVITAQVSPIEVVRALNPESHFAAFSRSNFIDILDWSTEKWLTIPTNSDELDELASPPFNFVTPRSPKFIPDVPVEWYRRPQILHEQCALHQGSIHRTIPFTRTIRIPLLRSPIPRFTNPTSNL